MAIEGLESDKFFELLTQELSFTEGMSKPRYTAIMGHLFVEIAINAFIHAFFPNPKKLIEKKIFSNKADMLYGTGILKENTYHNVRIINSIRNDYAHLNNPNDLEPNMTRILSKLDSFRHPNPNSPYFELKDKFGFPDINKRIFIAVLTLLIDQLQEDFSEAVDKKEHS